MYMMVYLLILEGVPIKISKSKYQILLSELDHLGYSTLYSTSDIAWDIFFPHQSEVSKLQLNSLWLVVD